MSILKTALVAGKHLTNYSLLVSGVAIGGTILGKVTEKISPRYEPVVSGMGDSLMGLVDPLDIFGYRKKKEDELKAKIAAGEASAKEQKAAKEAAKKRLKKAEADLKKAEKLARENARKAEKAAAEGKAREAEAFAKMERAQDRFAEITKELIKTSKQASASGQDAAALSAAQKAAATAQQATNPIMSTVQAVAATATDAGKAIVSEVYDSVHRDQEPDYQALAERIMQGDGSAYLELEASTDMGIEGVVAGRVEDGEIYPDDECRWCGAAVAGTCCASCARVSMSREIVGCGCGLASALAGDDDEVGGDDDEVSGDDDEVSGDDDEVSGDDDEVSGDDDEVAGFELDVSSDDEDEEDEVYDQLVDW